MSKPTVLTIEARDPSYVGGTELYCRELSHQLSEAGYRSVVAFAAPPSPSVARLLDLPDTVVEVAPDPCAPSVRSARDFVRLVRRYRPRVVHMHFTGMLGPYPWLARLGGVRQVWFTDRSSRPADHVVRAASVKCRLAWRALNAPVTGVVCPSRFGLRCMQGLRVVPPERLHLVYNGADLKRAERGAARRDQVRSDWGIPSGGVVAVKVSWMVPEKGHADLLRAVQRARAEVSALHLVMAGDGPDRAALERLARELGLDRRVTWTGQVDDPLGAGVYAAADIVCQVSRWQELFGLTIAEGMAAGRPVLGTRTGGIPELVENGETGWLVEPGDVCGIADRLVAMAGDADGRARWGQAGERAASARFDLRRNVARLVGLYGARGGTG